MIDIQKQNNEKNNGENPRWDTPEHRLEWEKYRFEIDWVISQMNPDELEGGKNNRVLVNSPDALKQDPITGRRIQSRDYVANMMSDLQNGNWRGKFQVERASGIGQHRQAADLTFRIGLGMEYNPETNRYEEPNLQKTYENIQSIADFDVAKLNEWEASIFEQLQDTNNEMDVVYTEMQRMIKQDGTLSEEDYSELSQKINVIAQQLEDIREDIEKKKRDLEKYVDEQREIMQDNRDLENDDYDTARRNIRKAEGDAQEGCSYYLKKIYEHEDLLGQLRWDVNHIEQTAAPNTENTPISPDDKLPGLGD